MKKLLLVFLIVIGLLSSIYQTFISKDYKDDPTHGPWGYRSKIYAGVKTEATIVSECFHGGMGILLCPFAPIAAVDMPFTFVADTLLLPYTVTSYQLNKAKLEKCIDNKRKQAAPMAGGTWKDNDVWCTKEY